MRNIKHETESGLSLFKGDILDSFILHIPHASTYIPNLEGFVLDKVEENINLLTDWSTDKIFDVDGIEKIVTPYSRLFCDVERFEDESEPMVNVGRGFFYTNGYNGSELRKSDGGLKELVHRDFYLKHHELFYNKVKGRLDKHGVCYIVDCHSFNDNPLVPFIEQPRSPDICIGADPYHTPNYLLNYTLNYFTNLGYSVEINNPYSGSIIPKPYFLKSDKVKGIMIEVNKRLYMNENSVNDEKVDQLRKVISGYFSDL
jgi:N-formylglutamate amidohydrolase